MNEILPKTKKSWAVRLLNPFVAIPLLILFLLLCAPFAYRGYKLSLVPDPGEPFDVAAFIKASQVDDADNALFDFQKAISLRGAMGGPDIDSYQFYKELPLNKEMSQEAVDYIKFIEGNEPAFQAWETGTLKLKFSEAPFVDQFYYSAPPVSLNSREFVRMFVHRAMLEAHNGNYEEAANNYLACARTARLIRQNGAVMQYLMSNAIFTLFAENLIKLIQDEDFPQDILEKLLQELTSIFHSYPPMSETLKCEYISVEKSFKTGLQEELFNLPGGEMAAGWLLYLSAESDLILKLNRQWLGIIIPEIDRPHYQRSRYTCKDDHVLLYLPSEKVPSNPRQMSPSEFEEANNASFLYGLLLFTNPMVANSEDRLQIRQQLLPAVLRLEIYRRKHGDYPAKLEDAFPNGKVPTDIFDPAGAPLRYKREADGSCKVWSVSFNGIDDGGISMGFGKDDTDFGYHLGKQEEPQDNEE